MKTKRNASHRRTKQSKYLRCRKRLKRERRTDDG